MVSIFSMTNNFFLNVKKNMMMEKAYSESSGQMLTFDTLQNKRHLLDKKNTEEDTMSDNERGKKY